MNPIITIIINKRTKNKIVRFDPCGRKSEIAILEKFKKLAIKNIKKQLKIATMIT